MKKNIVLRSDFLALIPPSERHSPESLVSAVLHARDQREEPKLAYVLSHMLAPNLLKGIDGAIEILIEALFAQKKILIVGDFDADGATSTAVLMRSLLAFGYQHVDFLVPNRFEYGYGLTPEIVDLALTNKPELIITVDNGISSIEGVAYAKSQGIRVLVTDHHLPGASLPEADAIVNPNQPGCAFPSKNLAGVGVIFYVMLALRAALRSHNWFTDRKIQEPNLAQFLDLVALGTVADVVALDENNRILVAQGIERIRAGVCCVGIQALMKIANKELSVLCANDFGFAVGPRLNAAGRLDDMSVGIRCLMTDDWHEALGIAGDLDALNQERRAIESSMQAEALRDLDSISESVADQNGVCLFREDWHQGVVGILASRIKDKMNRPTIAFAQADNGELKGSGRSVNGVHLRDVLDEIAAFNPSLILKFGGHAMAAGLSILAESLTLFQSEFDRVVGKYLNDEIRNPVVISDGELDASQFSIVHAKAIREAGPWGQAFPEPVFHGIFRIVDQKIVGAKHLKLMLSPNDFDSILVDAIVFNVDLTLWPNTSAQSVLLAYKIDVNVFRGRESLQLMVNYIEAK